MTMLALENKTNGKSSTGFRSIKILQINLGNEIKINISRNVEIYFGDSFATYKIDPDLDSEKNRARSRFSKKYR